MRTSPRRARAAVGLAVVAALSLSACAAGSADADDAASDERLTIETEWGEVTVPAEPTAALGFYTTDLDMLIALGYELADEQPIRDDYSAFPEFFPQDALAGITGFHNYPEFNYEKVLEVGPDFILNGLGYEDGLHERLSDIAPTYTYNAFSENADWRESFAQLAKDLGRTEQHQAWVDAYQARVDEVRAKLDAAGLDPVVADLSYWNGELSVGCYGVPCLVFADLGLEISPLADGDGDGEVDQTGTKIPLERLGDLSDIDVVFSGASPGADGLDGFIGDEPSLTGNSLWQALPAVQAGELYGYDYEMLYGSPSGQLAFLDVVEQALIK